LSFTNIKSRSGGIHTVKKIKQKRYSGKVEIAAIDGALPATPLGSKI
jgi:hypothetical protein